MKPMGETLGRNGNGKWEAFRWAVAIVFGAGMAYSYLQTIPDLQQRVYANTADIAVLKNDISYIKQGIERLLDERRYGRR